MTEPSALSRLAQQCVEKLLERGLLHSGSAFLNRDGIKDRACKELQPMLSAFVAETQREKEQARDDAEYWQLVAEGIKHSHRCPNNALCSPSDREHSAPCDRCCAAAAADALLRLREQMERLCDSCIEKLDKDVM